MKEFVTTILIASVLAPSLTRGQSTNGSIAAPQDIRNVLHEGTPVRMRIARTLSSADATEGENVDFETLDDIKVGDAIVIPKSSIALATVTEAQSKRRMARGGKLDVNIDYVRLPTGEKLALRGVQDVKGGGHTGAMTGGMVATSIVFFPAAPFFLFMKGKDVSIPKGHEVTVYTSSDYNIDPVKFGSSIVAAGGSASNAKPKLSGKPLTNGDIIQLKQAGFSDALIISKIVSAPAAYQLDTPDLISLKKSGVSDQVIAEMVKASQR